MITQKLRLSIFLGIVFILIVSIGNAQTTIIDLDFENLSAGTQPQNVFEPYFEVSDGFLEVSDYTRIDFHPHPGRFIRQVSEGNFSDLNFDFAPGLRSLTFVRMGTSLGASTPGWILTLFDSDGNVLGSIGDGNTLIINDPIKSFSFSAPDQRDIASARLENFYNLATMRTAPFIQWTFEFEDFQLDSDNDGINDDLDNCPTIPNAEQSDLDNDGLGDVCDVCPNDPNNDIDGDGICGNVDNCPAISNAAQSDSDNDGLGDVCDPAFTISSEVAEMIDYINNTLNLTSGQVNSLTIKLDDVLDQYCDGKEKQAFNKLNAFVNEVLSLEAEGEILSNQALTLIEAAQAIINAINNEEEIDGCPVNGSNLPILGNAYNSVSSRTNHLDLHVFPNPANDKVNIRIASTGSKTQVVIFDIYRRVVWQQETEPYQTTLIVDFSGNRFGTGMYVISAANNNGRQTRRVLITK